ncbi:hypothetical protein [Salarchaeum sp. JOR-1]|uniref:hypothetical protein n=1 Tax=Salarchaeum sp. JOR-1 TaxID=2599399 RepID=UPI001198C663|nr:hypothetical protein [Salarchaeum sp. JOR-1]QDX40473.1 hypothetical protein FQU85_06010 [Salarchaeum sp. JOR-1]
MPALDTDAARDAVRERDALLDTIGECADAVAATWDADAVADSDRLTPLLRRALTDAGVLDALPAVLQEAVDAAGGSLTAPPVAAPPHVVVTSRGPLLRATVDDARLLVRFDCFDVTENAYRRRDGVTVTVETA